MSTIAGGCADGDSGVIGAGWEPCPGELESGAHSRSDCPRFPGFEQLSAPAGTYWDYAWTYASATNGRPNPLRSGVMRIELTRTTGATEHTLLQAAYETIEGDDYPLSSPKYPYLRVEQGAIYAARGSRSAQVVVLFDPHAGSIGARGFMGYLSAGSGTKMYEARGTGKGTSRVVANESLFDPECEYEDGEYQCDSEYHHYRIQEYYAREAGFMGFYRAGTSIFSSGGHASSHSSVMSVRLTDTNIDRLPTR